MKSYDEWPSSTDLCGHLIEFTPFIIHATHYSLLISLQDLAKLQISQECVDLSSNTFANVAFPGNPVDRETVSMSLSSFIDGVLAMRTSGIGTHWTHNLGMNLYLAQMTLYSNEDIRTTAKWACIYPNIKQLAGYEISEINLWVNLFEASSNLHYDAYNNMLFVIEGMKQVVLISPSQTNRLKPFGSYLAAPNYSHISNINVNTFFEEIEDVMRIEVTVSAGEALFIPEGWWHFVSSDSCTVALNYWLTSTLTQQNEKAPHIQPYVLRKAVHSCVQQKLIEIVKLNVQTMRYVPYSDDCACVEVPKRRRLDESTERTSKSISQYDGFVTRVSTLLGTIYETNNNLSIAANYTSKKLMSSAEAAIILVSFHEMVECWPRYAREHPDEWKTILLSLSACGLVTLTTLWECLERSVRKSDLMASSIGTVNNKQQDDLDSELLELL